MKNKYWILTIQQEGNFSSKMYVHEGELSEFILERVYSRSPFSIINQIKIAQIDYNRALIAGLTEF